MHFSSTRDVEVGAARRLLPFHDETAIPRS